MRRAQCLQQWLWRRLSGLPPVRNDDQVRVDPARFRPNDLPTVEGDPTRIRAELGWTPAIPLQRTLDDLLDYWRAQVNADQQKSEV